MDKGVNAVSGSTDGQTGGGVGQTPASVDYTANATSAA